MSAHPLVVLDELERELQEGLVDRAGVEVLAFLRFAVLDDRGGAIVSLAAAPPAATLERIDTATRGQLADALRRVATAFDPGGRAWLIRKIDETTYYVERGDYRMGPYNDLRSVEAMQRTLNMLEREDTG